MEGPVIPEVDNGNLFVYVSNDTHPLGSKKDINVRINGLVAADDEFESTRHNYPDPFEFSLDDGLHALQASTDNGDITADTTFFLTDTLHCIVALVGSIPAGDYWFIFRFYDYPPIYE